MYFQMKKKNERLFGGAGEVGMYRLLGRVSLFAIEKSIDNLSNTFNSKLLNNGAC